jgi:hypothetical protein
MKKQKIELQTALQNNETFLAFLTQEVQSEKYKQLRKTAGKTPHLSEERLYDYVLGWLDDQDARQVRDHIALCGECAQEAMRIMQFEDELEEDSLDWADTSPTFFEKPVDRLKADVKTGSSTEKDIFQPTSKKVSITESLVRWISELWEPQWAGQPATAADIPQQAHSFTSEDGDIKLSCYWKGQYKDEPAYIQIAWKADLITEDEIWIRFMNPLTQVIRCEVCLGTSLVGEETFTSRDLGFDPSDERWAISVVLQTVLE